MSALMWALAGVACGSLLGVLLLVWFERRWQRTQRALDYWTADGLLIERQSRQLQHQASQGIPLRRLPGQPELRA